MAQQVDIDDVWNDEEITVTSQMYLNGGSLHDQVSAVTDVVRIFHGKRPMEGERAGAPLSRKGVVGTTGGRYIQVNLDTADVHTTEVPGNMGALNPEIKATAKQAAWVSRDVWSHVTVDRKTKNENKGPAQIENIVQHRTGSLMRGIAENFNGYYLGDGTGLDGEAPDGLQLFIKKTPTSGYVGSLNQASAAVQAIGWQNKYSADLKANAYPATFATDMQGPRRMQEMRMVTGLKSKGAGSMLEYPDYFLVTTNFWLAYCDLALNFRENGPTMTSELGFDTARFAKTYMLPVPGMDAEAAAIGDNVGICRMLNTRHIYVAADKSQLWPDSQWTEVSKLQPKDSIYATNYYGQLITDNPSKNAYLEVTDCSN